MNEETKDVLPPVQGSSHAFFFDVDGTLANIKPRPEEVCVPEHVCRVLQILFALSEGAMALVSGRPISQLDVLVKPLKLPVAGVHGAERRDACGNFTALSLPDDMTDAIINRLSLHLGGMSGTRLETKGVAFALHYRQAMQYEKQIFQLAESMVARYPMLTLQPGKCVVELKPDGADKGAAIAAFMREAPFIGRIPVFIGDDLTDEAGFQQVNQMKGISIKVGSGESHARYRLRDVCQVHTWLEGLIQESRHDQITSVRSKGYESFSGRI